MNTVGVHAANEAAIKVRNRELTPMQAYDALVKSVAHVYSIAGHPIPDSEREHVRNRLESILNAGNN
ncbi:hypothetical protein [Streptomyces sp. NBC_01451]|uniref:hypothetical protein n=1 Tax=Streptomyces sp. NBC_01451 TaxID=2903872 RepID=UPI002E328F33|nr:hypothetical protein [Streptomyces sp. NBC_01451]